MLRTVTWENVLLDLQDPQIIISDGYVLWYYNTIELLVPQYRVRVETTSRQLWHDGNFHFYGEVILWYWVRSGSDWHKEQDAFCRATEGVVMYNKLYTCYKRRMDTNYLQPFWQQLGEDGEFVICCEGTPRSLDLYGQELRPHIEYLIAVNDKLLASC